MDSIPERLSLSRERYYLPSLTIRRKSLQLNQNTGIPSPPITHTCQWVWDTQAQAVDGYQWFEKDRSPEVARGSAACNTAGRARATAGNLPGNLRAGKTFLKPFSGSIKVF